MCSLSLCVEPRSCTLPSCKNAQIAGACHATRWAPVMAGRVCVSHTAWQPATVLRLPVYCRCCVTQRAPIESTADVLPTVHAQRAPIELYCRCCVTRHAPHRGWAIHDAPAHLTYGSAGHSARDLCLRSRLINEGDDATAAATPGLCPARCATRRAAFCAPPDCCSSRSLSSHTQALLRTQGPEQADRQGVRSSSGPHGSLPRGVPPCPAGAGPLAAIAQGTHMVTSAVPRSEPQDEEGRNQIVPQRHGNP